MSTVRIICEFLDSYAPLHLAEEWDNVGLLVGDPDSPVKRLMTCLTITPPVVEEAVAARTNMIVTHHPMPFSALKRITSETTVGRILLNVVQARIAIHSPHTAFDSAGCGINQRLAEGLGLSSIHPLRPSATETGSVGGGRYGRLTQSLTLAELATRVKQFLNIDQVQLVCDAEQMVESVAVGCGSGGAFLKDAIAIGCDVLVLGETNYHTCLEAQAQGIGLILTGHYASERFGVERLADVLAERFNEVEVWASRRECEPLNAFYTARG